jgi:hypothetical protein
LTSSQCPNILNILDGDGRFERGAGDYYACVSFPRAVTDEVHHTIEKTNAVAECPLPVFLIKKTKALLYLL